jgi:PIN domain nuclease of toxin-antitoxin system
LQLCWEIVIKAGLGKLKLGEPSASFLSREITGNNFELLPISLDHGTAVETLPLHHRDPFDRLLVAQALVDSLPLVSADAPFDLYPVTRLW